MINSGDAIKDVLLADAPLFALTGNNLWPNADKPPAGYKPAMGGGIAFKPRGGGVNYNLALQSPSMQFICWGVSDNAAQLLYGALFDALKYPTGGIRSVVLEVLGQPTKDENNWPIVIGFWKIWLSV